MFDSTSFAYIESHAKLICDYLLEKLNDIKKKQKFSVYCDLQSLLLKLRLNFDDLLKTFTGLLQENRLASQINLQKDETTHKKFSDLFLMKNLYEEVIFLIIYLIK